GPGRVRCVMMPSPYTAPESVEDAATLARALGVRLESVSIDIPMQAFGALLKPHLKPDTPSVTYENIQPRCRGLILMALSNASGFLVLSTGNKSEMAVGYATLYGDMCGGFNPLKDLYKNQVYALAHWRNARAPGGALIPQRILTRAPTAELKPNQTDQDTLPPYDILDDILEALIEQDLGLSDIVARGHDPAVVAKVWKMLDAAEYKRRQASPGLKITARAFGRDRRYPITNHFTKVMT
ncbi:MAG TPA: NAD(+) synthase, partial [Alphaproteobacteria bacterium]|nr:NAD(+) synthase [Alphaproteobacteria bacterium]